MKKIVLIVIALALTALLGRAYWAYQQTIINGYRNSSAPIVVPLVKETKVATPDISTTTVQQQSTALLSLNPKASSTVSGPLKCKSDYQCFIRAAKSCELATMEQTLTTKDSNLHTLLQWTYAIEGKSDGSLCASSQRILDAQVKIVGISEEQKTALSQTTAFKQIEEKAHKDVGRVIRCKLTPERTVEKYTKLSQGVTSVKSSDNCEIVDVNGKPWVGK